MTQNSTHAGFTNYAAYRDPKALGQSRIGHLDLEKSVIQPLSFVSGTPLANLYQVIEIGESQIKPFGEVIPLSSVELLAPISGRDVLAVGKNYSEHAKEFNSSGYDSSDKVDQPTHPVIFTKRATSIISSGELIFPHPRFTESCDYEGEIGVIIGKSGFRIKEADAMDYVWGYTIINDMTARERQRDHKQFYIGKSPDTFCPIVSVTLGKVPKVGEKRSNKIFRVQLQCLQANFPSPSECKLTSTANRAKILPLRSSSFPSHSSFTHYQKDRQSNLAT